MHFSFVIIWTFILWMQYVLSYQISYQPGLIKKPKVNISEAQPMRASSHSPELFFPWPSLSEWYKKLPEVWNKQSIAREVLGSLHQRAWPIKTKGLNQCSTERAGDRCTSEAFCFSLLALDTEQAIFLKKPETYRETGSRWYIMRSVYRLSGPSLWNKFY